MKAKKVYENINEFISINELIPGKIYLAQDLGPKGEGTGEFAEVKVLSINPDDKGMYDVKVEYDGIIDKWYLEENDPVFKKL